MWLRGFVTSLAVAALAMGCKRAPKSSTEEIALGSSAAGSAVPATIDAGTDAQTAGARSLDVAGYSRVGRAPFAFDGEELLELEPGALVRRDASLAVVSRVAVTDARSFAVLGDRSIVVLAEGRPSRRVHHVVGGKVVATHDANADLVLPSAAPTAYWAVSASQVKRRELGTAKDPATVFLPENTYAQAAVAASDGSLVIPSVFGLLRIDRAVSTFAWDNAPHFLGPGPDASTVWAALGPIRAEGSKLALLKLGGDRATAIATHALAPEENIVHAAGAGIYAAVIVARTLAPHRAAFTLIVYDAKGERWRAQLGEESTTAYYAVVSPTRVVVAAKAPGTVRAWDLATGKPAS